MVFTFVTIFGLFTLALTAFSTTELHAGKKPQDRLHSLLKRAAKAANLMEIETQSLSVQSNLRTVNEESRFRQGYGFLAEFNSATCDDADFRKLTVFKLNDCGAANDKIGSIRTRAWTTVKGNLGFTFNEWEDDQCREGWRKDDVYMLDDTCFFGFKAWTGPFTEIPAFLGNAVGFYGISDNQKCLDSKNPWKDFSFAEIHRIGECIEYDPEEPDRDAMVTSCSETLGVQVKRFNSNDGSCVSEVDNNVYNPKNVCLWYDFFEETTFGWTKYECYSAMG